MKRIAIVTLCLTGLALVGCAHDGQQIHGGTGGKIYGGPPRGPAHDRPFPIGQVTDAFWETQQTNAEAADFVIYDHEFRWDTQRSADTAQLTPGGKKHLEMIALRLEHVPFPIVIEQSQHNARQELDHARRRTVLEGLARMGVTNVEPRVVIANRFAEGFTAVEAERSYYGGVLGGGFGGNGRRFGGTGGFFR